jgi:branched-chain amino acid transport system ATP-binding protein
MTMRDFSNAPPVLQIQGLNSHYGPIHALHGIDIDVRQGQLVALVGANGAGKTTLLRAISGVQPVSGGSIRFGGADITRMSADQRVRAGICQVPEGRQVFGPMSVEDNLRLGAYTRPKGELAADLERVFGLFPVLKEKRALTAGMLSGGQQQMCAIARALMSGPKLVLLDEPSMGLAPVIVAQVFDLVRRLRGEGYTVLIVEQNVRQVLKIADRAYLLEVGRIKASGSSHELLASDEIRKAYMGI